MDRPKCIFEGCNKFAVKAGAKRYRKLCWKHYAEKYGKPTSGNQMRKRHVDNSKCQLCGWVGPCDGHRIIYGCNGGKYSKGNVNSVCPNCHRLIHAGLLSIR